METKSIYIPLAGIMELSLDISDSFRVQGNLFSKIPINNMLVLVEIMAWHAISEKPAITWTTDGLFIAVDMGRSAALWL